MGSERGSEAGLSQHLVVYIRERCRQTLAAECMENGGFQTPRPSAGDPLQNQEEWPWREGSELCLPCSHREGQSLFERLGKPSAPSALYALPLLPELLSTIHWTSFWTTWPGSGLGGREHNKHMNWTLREDPCGADVFVGQTYRRHSAMHMQVKKQHLEPDVEQQTSSDWERSASRLYIVTLLA